MNSPLLIAHILPWSEVGGTEHATLRLAKASEPDFASILYCRDDDTVVHPFCDSAGFRTASYAAIDPSYRRAAPFIGASLRLARDFRQRGVALVHCSDLLAAQYTALAARMAGLPVISHVRNRTSAIPHRYKTVLNLVNRFVFVSKDTWRQFGYRVPHSRGSVLYDGFDMPDFGTEPVEDLRSQLGVSASAKLIGMAARVNPQKDYRTLIEAAVHVVKSEPEARFLVIGDYERLAEHREHYTKVQEWLRTSGMEPYFIFAGYRTQVPRLLRALDIFVLSTNYEGLPLVILEAMACAKPVVATAVDGVPEVVRHRETGLLHAPGDSVALANDLLELLHNPDRAAALGVAGRRLVEAEFSGRRFAEDVHRLYRDMLHLPQG